MTLIECLKLRKEQSGMSVVRFCETIDLAQSSYSGYTRGKYSPRPDEYIRLAKVLKFDPNGENAAPTALAEFDDLGSMFKNLRKDLDTPLIRLLSNHYHALINRYSHDLNGIRARPITQPSEES